MVFLKLQFSSFDNDAPLNVPFSFPCRSSFCDIIYTAPKAKPVKFNSGIPGFLDYFDDDLFMITV